MPIITLTTDYGLKDYFLGALKGKILSQFPEVTIVDISHQIESFNILEAGYIIEAAYPSFPKGTIHVIGIDIEDIKNNQPLAMLCDNQYFIAANNGILDILARNKNLQNIVEINIENQPHENHTTIDIFIKTACLIAKGAPINSIGQEIKQIVKAKELQAFALDNNTIKGNIIYIDSFGNAVSNISKKYFSEIANGRSFEIILKDDLTKEIRTAVINDRIRNIFANYSEIFTSNKFVLKDYEGKKMAVFNEQGLLEITIFRGNPKTVGSASTLLGLKYLDEIKITFLNK